MSRFLVILMIFFAGGLSLLVGFARTQELGGTAVGEEVGTIGVVVSEGR